MSAAGNSRWAMKTAPSRSSSTERSTTTSSCGGTGWKGHRFATDSDTEVLVHLYEEVGERLPERLNGMFAFAIWDARKQELFLARDPFGKKPLYYSTAVPGFRFCFASELKALTVMPGFDSALNPESLADFLAFSYVPDPQTIYRNVWKLQPGRSLLVSAAGSTERRYWTPPSESDERPISTAPSPKLEALAGDSVERRMIADVPLGGFLSGGVDSSAVVAFMAQRAGHQVKTFSIGFTDEAYSEVRYARMVAGAVRRPSTTRRSLRPRCTKCYATLVEHYDEPFADASAIPTLYLARMTRRVCHGGALRRRRRRVVRRLSAIPVRGGRTEVAAENSGVDPRVRDRRGRRSTTRNSITCRGSSGRSLHSPSWRIRSAKPTRTA